MPTARKLTPEESEKYDDSRRERQRRRIDEIKLRYAMLHEPWRFIPCLNGTETATAKATATTEMVIGNLSLNLNGTDSCTGMIQNDTINSDGSACAHPPQAGASTCSTISSQDMKSESSVMSPSLPMHEKELQANSSGLSSSLGPLHPITTTHASAAVPFHHTATTSHTLHNSNGQSSLPLSHKIYLPPTYGSVQGGIHENSYLAASESVAKQVGFTPTGESTVSKQNYSSYGTASTLNSSQRVTNIKIEEDDGHIERLTNGIRYESHDADALEKLLLQSETDTDAGGSNNTHIKSSEEPMTTGPVPNPLAVAFHNDASPFAINELIRLKSAQNNQMPPQRKIDVKNNSPLQNSPQCTPSNQLQRSDIENARIWNIERTDTAEKLKKLIEHT